MNREKQIDEMAKDLCHTDTCEIKKIGIPCNHRCKAHIYAARAIDKGYRKASEVAEAIFAEIERILDTLDKRHMLNGSPKQAWGVRSVQADLAELKKKYTITEEK